MKCRTVEELRTVKDGVTPDCYSYSNFIFRHLKKRDYTVGACIGSKVSRARQQDYEADAQRLKKELDEAKRMADGLKAVREMESLKEDPAYLESLSRAAQELEAVLLETQETKATIEGLRMGAYKELEEKGQKLYGGIEEILKEAGSEYHVNHVSSLGSLFFAKEEVVDYTSAKSSDTKAFADYFLAMLKQGIHLAPSQFEAMFLSTAHSDEVLEDTLTKIRNYFM